MANRRNPLSYRYGYSLSWPNSSYYRNDDRNMVILHQILSKMIDKNEWMTHYQIKLAQNCNVKIIVYLSKSLGKSSLDIASITRDVSQEYRKRVTKFNKGSLLKDITNDNMQISFDVKQAPITCAERIAKSIKVKTLKRIHIRNVVNKEIKAAIDNGVQGIKVVVAGRIGGAEMSSTEKFIEGRMPLSTIKAVISHSIMHINMSYGVIGVKVTVYHHNSSSNIYNSLT